MMDPAWKRAIAAIESGGAYDRLGPLTNGDRAYGKYQVMGSNIGPWSQAALGRSMTPDEFLANPDAQEKVFEHRFGGYVDKYGNPQDAASVWFTGRPQAQGANARDILGTTGASYVDKFNRQLGSMDGASAIQAALRQPQGDPSPAMAFAPGAATAAPSPSLMQTVSDRASGFDWGDGLTGIGAALQSIDNPRGAAALAALMAQGKKAEKKTFTGQYDPKSGTYFRLGSDGTVDMMKNPNAKDEAEKPKLSEKAIQNVSENMEKYGTIAAINQEGSDVLDMLHSGKLDLGLFKNWVNSGRNMAGISDEQSRAFAKYQQFLQKVSNDNLLLNKGVQTEGDAYREMKAIAAGGANYDNEAAKEALTKLLKRGEEAVTQRGRAVLDAHRAAYGDAPFVPFEDQARRWGETYSNINKRLEGYAKPKEQSDAPKPQFKIINVR